MNIDLYLETQKVVKKNKTTFLIEDERFDKPLNVKISLEDKDFTDIKDWIVGLENKIDASNKEHSKIYSMLDDAGEVIEAQIKRIDSIEKDIDKIQWVDRKQCTAINAHTTDIKNINLMIEKLSDTINHLEEKLNEFEKKLTKQPRIFKDKIFISWNEEVMLGLYDVPDWDYLCITNIEIWEHNEYCLNKDWVMIDKIHVQDWFTPRYQLYWGTELDTPTATVYYALLLIPM